jgi:hypothetical protein
VTGLLALAGAAGLLVLLVVVNELVSTVGRRRGGHVDLTHLSRGRR